MPRDKTFSFRLPALLLVALTSASCDRKAPAPPASSLALATAPLSEQAEARIQRRLPYPRGRWRLAHPEELSSVVLWFSHVLIRYRGALDEKVSFSLHGWSSAYPPPEQS